MKSLIRLFGVLALAGLRLHAASFTSGGPITFPDTSASRQASPYPSAINVSGVPLGTITNVTVTISNLTHPRPDDIEMLLVSPWGAKLVIMADVGGTVTPASGVTITLSDAAGSLLPDGGPLTGGTFKPTCVDNLNNIATEFPGQTVIDPTDTAAPNGAATFTSVFGGSHDPNGIWNLYVVDDVSSTDAASFSSWTINVGTSVATVGTFLALTSAPNPSFVTTNVTFTATVRKQTDSNVVTTGTVTFREGGTTLASGLALNGSGQAAFSTAALTEGDHVITADYVPGAGFLASTTTRTQRVDGLTIRNGTVFCNTNPLALSALSPGTANVYPSHIFVSALTGTIAKVTLTLSNLTINRPDDLSLLLVGPTGANFLVLNDAGGTALGVSGVTLLFDDSAASLVPDAGAPAGGAWRPSSYGATGFPAPAPAGPYNSPAPSGSSTFTNIFNGTDPNGTWSLYAFDDVSGDGGTIAGGWCLNFTLTTNAPTTTTVASSANPSLSGASVTFTATVRKASDSSLVTAGTVTFREGGSVLAGPVALNGSGQAAFTTSALGEGQHTITADYNGAALFNTSSGSVTQAVNNPTLVSGSTFCNTGAIQVASGQTAAGVYPSRILVSGIGSSYCKMSVTLSNLSADVPDDVELLLVSPNGAKFVLLSDAGGFSAVNNVTLTFRDDAASLVPDSGPLGSGAYRPTDVSSTPASFPAPAPAAPYAHPAPIGAATLAGTFGGAGADGYWSLYVVDDVAGGTALTIAGGWCLNFTLPPAPVIPLSCTLQTNYFASFTFTDAPPAVATGLAFDGAEYWSCSGGSSSGNRLARYDSAGNLITLYAPGLDFRSVFQGNNCAIMARAYNDRTIYVQTSPGVFVNSGVTLTGGTLDSQASVVMNGPRTEFIAMSAGAVSRWDLAGAFLGSVTLNGFGSVPGEATGFAARGIAAFGNYWLTYNAGRILSIWDTAGNRVISATLSGAGVNPTDSAVSFSFCNGKAFVVDVSNGLWRGYDICGGAGNRVAVFGAPSGAGWNADVQAKIAGAGTISQVDAFLVNAGNPVPALAQLRQYQSVLVYSDSPFNDATALGNVLADYVDQGGGVVLATFGFGSGLSLQGRFVSGGYMPLTISGQSSPGNLTLVKDLPAHPILDGVSSFNGGTASFHNSPVATSNATLVAHWNNGQPLVAAKDVGPGRVVGLNFYPPSSSARADFWSAATDGGRLMANALTWAGRQAPQILSGPGNQVTVVGANVSLTVAAAGAPALLYQWRKGGVSLANATNSSLNFIATLASAGQYSVVVSNTYGFAYSSNALLTVFAATNIVLDAVDTGWYNAAGNHSPGNPNFFVGNDGNTYFRNWFVFNVPPLPGPVTHADLRVNTFTIIAPTGSEIYQLQQVTTPVATLMAGGSGLTAIFNDLGDGPAYGASAFVPAKSDRFVTLPLNQNARAAVAASAGSSLALGGQIITLDTDVLTMEAAFSFSGAPGSVQLLLTVGTGEQPVVGYFSDGSPSLTGPEAPITNAGFAAVLIGDISTQNFSGLRLLMINEVQNGAPSAALTARLPAIRSWVEAGGRLLVHDRGAGSVSPNPFLLGTPGLGTVRNFTADLDVIDPATTLVTAGPFGVITNTSLDGGGSSAHGYVPSASLPAGARAILNFGPGSNQVAGFSYPLGAGFVYYSTIPLDCYLAGSGCQANVIATNLQTIYTPNLLHYLHTLNSPLRFRAPAQPVAGAWPLLVGAADGSPLNVDRQARISLYSGTNVAAPLAGWNQLFNPTALTNGLLRVDGLNATGAPPLFFRAVESP